MYYFPFRYIDKSKVYKISDLEVDMPYVQIKGEIIRFEDIGIGRTKKISGTFTRCNRYFQLVWFKGMRWIKSSFKIKYRISCFGKPSFFKNNLNIVHPEIDLWDDYNKKTSYWITRSLSFI